MGFGMLIFGTHGILNSISTSLEHPTVSTLLEQPKYGCSYEVLFLAFLALKMALRVNCDLKFEICGLCSLCWYSHISHLGFQKLVLAKSKKIKIYKKITTCRPATAGKNWRAKIGISNFDSHFWQENGIKSTNALPDLSQN